MKLNINGKEVEVSDEDITKAITDKAESFAVKIEGVTIRSEQEETDFKANTETSGRNAGIEIGRKNLLKGLGIEVDGAHKSDEKAIAAMNTFTTEKITTGLADAKIEPDKRVKDLQDSNAILVANNQGLQSDFDAFKQQSVVKDQNQSRLNTFSKHIPDNSINDRDNTLVIMGAGIKTGFSEDGILHGVDASGKPIRDPQTQNLLPIENVISNFFNERPTLLTKSQGGAGGGDSGGGAGGKQTLDEFIEEQQKAGIEPNSEKFRENMSAKQKAGTLEV